MMGHHPSARHTIAGDGDVLTVAIGCPLCATPGTIEVPREGYMRWIAGGAIRIFLPSLDATAREKFLAGICESRWARVFEDGPEGAARLVGFLARGVDRRDGKEGQL